MTGVPIMPCNMPVWPDVFASYQRVADAVRVEIMAAADRGDDVRGNMHQNYRLVPGEHGFWRHEPHGPLRIEIQILPKE